MIRITALNEESSDNSSRSQDLELITKEAQEEEALELYNRALELQRCEKFDESENLFTTLLNTELLSRAAPSDDPEELLQPCLRLKYSAYKNLASIYLHRKDNTKAMKYLLDASEIDDSDVSLWYKVGTVAMKIHRYILARLAFEEGLRCNENHWPCLDNLITVLYVLNDYASCLHNIAKGLKRENGFLKGMAFRDAIFKEHAGLKNDIHHFYSNCDILDIKEDYDSEIGQKFIDEALEMRQKKRELSKPKSRPVLTLQKPLKSYTWKHLGKRLCELYDFVKNSTSPVTPGCAVDLSQNINPAPSASGTTVPDVESSPSSSISQTPFTQPLIVTTAASPQVCVTSGSTSPSQSSTLLTTAQATSAGPQIPSLNEGFELTDMDTELAPSGEYADDGSLLKRGSKRKRQRDEIAEMAAAKRRSTRVRNTAKKPQQENVNYFELLQEFLPSEFCYQDDEYETCMTPTVECDNHITNDHHYGHSGFQIDCSPRPLDCTEFQSTEETDVKQFLSKHLHGHTLVYILYSYLCDLGSKNHLQWPPGLDDVYMCAYIRSRKHFEHPSVMFQEQENEFIRIEAIMTLIYNEFKMEKWQNCRPRPSASPISSPRNQLITSLGPNFPGTYFLNDMDFLLQASTSKDIFEEIWPSFVLRTFWLHSRYQILAGDAERALNDLNQMKFFIDAFEVKDKVNVPNCAADNVIAMDVRKQMDSIRRCQSLEEVQRLYDQQQYDDVVKLLVPTFNEKQHLKHKVSCDIPERHAQLLILQNSLSNLQDYKKCVEWGEEALNEALQQYTIVSGITARTDWGNTMTQLLESLERCFVIDLETIACLPVKQLKRLCQNLIKIISVQMNGPDLCSEMSINTMLPWILLYRLVLYDEMKCDNGRASKLEPNIDAPVTHESLNNPGESKGSPSSLKLLFTAHDCLGRRSWCCSSEGGFLLSLAEILLGELHVKYSWLNPHPHRIEIENNLEQCFYCLYGHPNKKTKAKHLQEHGSPQILLTWGRAQMVFEYFKPFEVPEFDSYKTSTISSEVENLLRRIVILVPTHKDPKNTPDTVMAYVEGSTEHYPVESNNQGPNVVPIVGELYYLLADYYFKNKEQGKAIKFYVLDICINPNHMDSWAGMALARSSQIEQKLNSNELKIDGPIFRKASAALRCFKRSVEIDRTNLALWIEYGSLAYQMQAHSSRMLKQKEQLVLSPDIVEMLKSKKEEMLETAYHCFKTASEFEDEDGVEEKWLHHYMLGKISEKRHMKEPKIYLTQYRQASMHLHKEGARYPKKINYHNPPYLSLESLEVFFRMHAASLKYVMKIDKEGISPEMLQYLFNYLSETAQGPLARYQELKVVNRLETEDNGKSNEKSSGEPSPEMVSTSSITPSSQEKESGDKENLLVAIDILDNLVTQVSLAMSPTASSFFKPKSDADGIGEAQKDNQEGSKPTELKALLNKFDIVRLCIKGFKQCLLRFPQHYKSFYRLAHYYMNTSSQTKLQWSCDFLISTTAGTKTPHIVCPGLFSERKNINFFNGIWRIPVDELDRPGSFAWHMYRSISLLHEILKRLKDMPFLYYLACQLHRIPDFGKKYLRDVDRVYLADQVYLDCVEMLRTQLDSLMQEEPPPPEERILACLLDIYKAWQALHKNVPDPDHINDLLEEAYTMYKLGEVDSSPPVVEQAISFCQNLQTQYEKERILQQQKALIQKQTMITQTLLSAGVQPCIPTGLGSEGATSTADASSISVFPGQ